MKFAVQVVGGQIRQEKTGIEAVIEQGQLAEEVGFDTAFVPDHYVFEALGQLQLETPAYEMFFVMATLAQRTKRIRIGSHVACMLYRHPAMHARQFAQVDEASGGRLIAGVGAGWTRAEFEMFGLDFPDISERLKQMDEAVAIMRGLWKPEPFSFQGRYYRVRDAVCLPRPIQQPPPLMLGGSGNGILRRAGEWADILHMIPVVGKAGTTTLPEVQKFNDAAVTEKLARVREHAAKAGRPAGAVKYASTIFNYQMTKSPEQTRKTLERLAAVFGPTPEDVQKHPIVLVGTKEEIIDELRRREKQHGLHLLAINFSSIEQVREFGEQIIPALS